MTSTERAQPCGRMACRRRAAPLEPPGLLPNEIATKRLVVAQLVASHGARGGGRYAGDQVPRRMYGSVSSGTALSGASCISAKASRLDSVRYFMCHIDRVLFGTLVTPRST
jgi:hypothetical protein